MRSSAVLLPVLLTILGALAPSATTLHAREGGHPGEGRQSVAPTRQAAPAPAAAPAATAEPTKAGAADATPPWDVENPPGERSEVPIDTTTGTWMSVDVAPDGERLVFDLLGDLYLLPITGGEATRLTAGLAWDEQPRFSPDGKSIAFTSDRAGGDNLWILHLDVPGADGKLAGEGEPVRGTSDARLVQVTKETFRLLNSPAWSPDGQYLVGRKHFTSQRSAGAGEIWIYHRSGGDGLQVVPRRNDQKDIGEPAFSPDGRHVYYSHDATAGDVFEYSKDPNGEIYAIDRIDRETGEVERWLGGPGGAIRPTLSPDGNWLAYIRRVRYRSVLMLHDQKSGIDRPLWDGLDRDLQEAWAIHGVYPGMDFTPDSRAVVVWAGGQLHRVDITSSERQVIPFHVADTRTVTPALRFPIAVAPEDVALRMLRWVRVAPDGSRVVYQALGKLWVRDLPDGKPQRLTTAVAGEPDVVELFPSFSRDGRFVVYTSWNDERLGTVRVVPAGGGAPRVLVDEPGHYVEPVLSPQNYELVYRSIGGNDQRGRAWSHCTGVFVKIVNLEGPPRKSVPGVKPEPSPGVDGPAVSRLQLPARLLTRDGVAPHFGADHRRVFLLRYGAEDHRELVSLDLDGSDERVHADSEAATDFQVSPDGRWLAWRERFQVFVTPFVATGRKVAIGPQATAMPLARVSKDAGAYLQWAGDSHRLWWSLGPELFHRDLAEAFTFLASPRTPGGKIELPEPPAKGTPIGFTTRADVPSGTVALVGGRVVTMRGDEVIDDGVVVVEGNRIRAVGRRGEVTIPAGAHQVDVSGKTVLPGLVDVHWHGDMGSDEIIPQHNWTLYASLAFGVTTIHDPSNDSATIFAASELARAGGTVGPRIFSTGTILYGAAGDFKAEIDSLEDARRHLRRMQALGAWSVKSYNQPRRDQRQQVIAAARELGMMVVPEGGSLLPHNLTMIQDGHTGIEHSLPQARLYDDVVQLFAQSATGYTPTLGVAYGGNAGENWWYQVTDVWRNERLLTFVPREVIDARSRRPIMVPEEEANHVAVARGAKQLLDRGVSVQLGAHGQREGLAAHWELWSFVQGGMTPHQALRAGTIAGARYLGLDRDLGSLEVGKLGDVIVVDRDPLQDIRNSELVSLVMVNGRLYDAATMHEVGNHPRSRGRFWWEAK